MIYEIGVSNCCHSSLPSVLSHTSKVTMYLYQNVIVKDNDCFSVKSSSRREKQSIKKIGAQGEVDYSQQQGFIIGERVEQRTMSLNHF